MNRHTRKRIVIREGWEKPARDPKGAEMTKESRARARRVADLLARNRADLVEECADYCEECGETFDAVAEFTVGIEDDIMAALGY